MSEFPFLSRVLEMLGPASGVGEDAGAWERLQGELGFELPKDYRKIIDDYAPVVLNYHFYLGHPATHRWNLRESIETTSKDLSGVDWEDVEGEEGVRAALGLERLEFGTPRGLVELMGSNRSETVLWAPSLDRPEGRIFCLVGTEAFFEYRCTFSEWLYRYLVGEDMFGPNSAAFYPGPVHFRRLPMTSGDKKVTWVGPDRGM
ncbi:hypothetical protein GCM10009716_27210 [Streptomyces sodiiphilus]|uniref:SMI1/KNR4 family protein n=1 Tax=Streptomyces sodiiphilus TaxID=226217 RepID=A0ABN2PAF0_9ACTN